MKYPTMSWKNNSTNLNDLAGTVTYNVPSSTFGQVPSSLTVKLPSFREAFDIHALLEAAYVAGKTEGLKQARITLDNL